ncbi:MAG: hypothetical protein ACREIE_00070 [Nitrospiraceae bacterium]
MATALLRIVPLLCCFWISFLDSGAAVRDDIFEAFTAHIQQQVQSDKQTFLDADTCTQWFYQEQRRTPPGPSVQGTALDPVRWTPRRVLEAPECQTRYPGGLRAAREDFSRTQTSLSLSLTFYEFALVGDRNDDGHYNAVELRDMLESFGLPFDGLVVTVVHLAALNGKFDAIHATRSLDVLMTSMGTLYDKGYRFTNEDRAALNRISE